MSNICNFTASTTLFSFDTYFVMSFLAWEIGIIEEVMPKGTRVHEYVLIAIGYFTKWIEVASYAKLPQNM